jgi:iron complex transport system permease protein
VSVGVGPVSIVRIPGRTAVRFGRASFVIRPRATVVTVAVLALTVLVGCWSVSVGDFTVPLDDVVWALFGLGDPGAVLVVQTLRLPRLLVGLLVGAAFGLAGAITSSVVRNPLATPDVIGVTAGASAAAVLVILGGWAFPLPLAALGGGLLVAVLVGALSWREGFTGPRLVLVGIGIGSAAAALTSYLLVRARIEDAQRAVIWLTGSLNGRGWEHVGPVGIALLVLVPVAVALGRGLATLRLGDDVAGGLGTRVTAVRVALVVVAVALAAVATASAGPVAFVALVAPQVALRLARTPGPPLAASAAVGALLVVAADLVGRRGFAAVGLPSTELPVGAVTALVGAPVLLWLLRRATTGRIA